MNIKMDPMGRAIADYHKNKKASKLRVFSPMFEEDEIPLTTLFRSYKSMPEIERKALDMAKGRVLDVGAGSGCHSLVLQEKGLDVTAIDISPLSVETMKERGVKKVFEQDFFTIDGQFDTILMLMNGIGIVGTLERLPEFFKQLDKILAPGGQVLCDSSDLSYVFETEDGIIELPDDIGYYGEQSFQMQYKDTIGEPFPWLYIDADTLKQVAEENGFVVEVVAEGEHYDYLAKITRDNTNEYVDKVVAKEELPLSQQAIEALEKLRLGESVDESLLTPDDQNKIGYCFYYGKNITQNYENAFHWYSLSADSDFPPAERNLGICYEKGHGIQRDEKLSAYWFERAASHGNADAQSEIAERYYVGNGVEKDEDRAWEWMEKAIKTAFDKKEPVLLNYLGDRHHYGDGMFEQNLDVAAMFYKKASDFGLPLGSLNSAAMILYGEADGTDEELEKFLSDAAKADLPMAQKWLDMLREKIEMEKGLTK